MNGWGALLLLVLLLLWAGLRLFAQTRKQRHAMRYYGVRVARQLLDLILLTQQHRGLVGLMLAGERDHIALIAVRRHSITDALNNIRQQLLQTASLNGMITLDELDLYQHDWEALLIAIGQGLANEAVFKRHTILMIRPLSWLTALGQQTIDIHIAHADDKVHFQQLFNTLPALAETLAQIRGRASGMLALGKSDALERIQLAQLRKKAENLLAQAQQHATSQTAQSLLLVEQFMQLVTRLFEQEDTLTMPSQSFFNEATDAIDTVFIAIEKLLQQPNPVQ